MLFRHLTIDGVGPFGGHHSIDLDALTAGGLFLLEGPTGSGKSSLIDAIVFALYGDTAGEESDYTRMRSTYADPTKASRVELIFTVSSGTYRIERTPRWNKPKRGGGTTQVSEHATLMRLSEVAVEERQWNQGEVLATGAREVGVELNNILGLNRAQFAKTVVLPQGQFADFLRLKSEERSKLLETLFNTGPYRNFSQQLHQQAMETSQAIEKKREQLSHAVATWLGNSAVTAWEDQAKELEATLTEIDDKQLLDFLTQCQEELAKHEEVTREKSQQAATALEKAGSELTAQKTLAHLLIKRSELLEQQATLTAEKPAIEANRQQVSLHHRAVVPMERLRAWEKIEQEKLSCKQAVIDALKPLKISYDSESLSTTKKQLTHETTKSQERLAHVQELALIEEQQSERTQNISELKEKIASYDEKLVAVNERHATIPQELKDTEKALTAAQKTVDELPEIKHEQEKLNHIAELVKDQQKLAKKVAQAQSAYAQLVTVSTEKSAHFQEINQRWIASQAAILSQELQPELPCPVCGSSDHPQPAKPEADHVSVEDVELAQQELEDARTELNTAQTKLNTQQTQLEGLAEQVKDVKTDDISEQLTQLAKRHDQADKAKELISQLSNKITQLHIEKEEVSAKRSEYKTAQEAAQENLTAEHNRYLAAQEKLIDALRDEEDDTKISDLISTSKKLLHSLEQATQSVREYEQAITRESSAQESLSQALKESDLTVAKAKDGFLAPEELAQLQADIQKFDSALNYVTEQLATPEIAELTGEEKPEVEQAELRHKQAQEAHEQAAQEAAIAREGAATAQRAAGGVVKAFDTWSNEVTKSGPLARLDQLAQAGKASHTNISLQVWVLLRRFDMVIDFANDYLNRFSRGRYELIRSSGGEKERKTGLGLSIIDHDARGEGESDIRSTRSLSGGETFYTALSLALGLTDVVQQENGGIRIDTLMIDEGFGTLSGEVLDEVMTTLTELARDGRKVGIISHVEELKSRIPNQIRITQAKGAGSTINVIS